MENILNIFNEIDNGNKETIKDFIVSTRLYVLNSARSIVEDDDTAIKVAKDVYNELILSNKHDNASDFLKSLNTRIIEISKKYSNDNVSISNIEKETSELDLSSINVNDYKEYYNNPAVEKVIFTTISALPKEEKEIVVRNYFGNETVGELAVSYGVSEETIESYINRANKLIESKSKPLFIKYKIKTANYKNAAIVYSTIKNIVSIATFDVLGIAADKVKDIVVDKEDEDNKDLKSFVEDIFEDLVQDWFLNRLKSIASIVTIGAEAASTTAKATSSKIAAGKTAASLAAKKVAIGVVAAATVTTGGIVAYNNLNKTKEPEPIKETIQEPEVYVAETTINSMPVEVQLYSDENDDNIGRVSATAKIAKDQIDSGLLKGVKLASKVVSGLDFDYTESDDGYIVDVGVDNDKINDKLIDFVESLGMFDESLIEQIEALRQMSSQELIEYLSSRGYSFNLE